MSEHANRSRDVKGFAYVVELLALVPSLLSSLPPDQVRHHLPQLLYSAITSANDVNFEVRYAGLGALEKCTVMLSGRQMNAWLVARELSQGVGGIGGIRVPPLDPTIAQALRSDFASMVVDLLCDMSITPQTEQLFTAGTFLVFY